MTALLQIEGAEKRFGSQEVLRGIDLSIEEGCITTLLGKSGSGKTVLLKAIAGLLPLDGGRILFRGQAMDKRRPQSRPPMSYLFQGDALFDSLTARENIALPLREGSHRSPDEIDEMVTTLLDKLDLGNMGSKYPSELSGGMRRRVALARALVVDPEIVLFDEPTTGLDPLRRNAVLELIHRDSRRFGFTALVVSHDVPESLFIADSAAILDDGVIAAQGAPKDLVSELPPESALHPFLHNNRDLRSRLTLATPEENWMSTEQTIRQQYDTLAIFTFCQDLAELDLAHQLRDLLDRRQVLASATNLGSHVSPAYALPNDRALIGFQGLDPAVTASILYSLPELAPTNPKDATLKIGLGSSRPDVDFSSQMHLLDSAKAQYFKITQTHSSLNHR